MTPSRDSPSGAKPAVCPHCKQDFLTYKASGPAHCPSCGARAHTLGHRRFVLALAAVAGLAIAVIVVVVLLMRT